MYFEHFGLKKSPFLLSTELDSFNYSRSQTEALAHLLYGIRQGNGIMLLLGAPGTGKTTLLRSLLDLLPSTPFVESVILSPMMETPAEVLSQVLAGFKIKVNQRSAMESYTILQQSVGEMSSQGKLPLLVIDEAQRLNSATLDCIRLISNLESGGCQSVRLLLAAQPELAKLISSEGLTAFRQRITVRSRLIALQFDEIWKYLAMRVAAAGGSERVIFKPEAAQALAIYSGGIPRVINLIADHCLVAAYAEGAEVVDERIVHELARELELTADELMQKHASQRSVISQFTSEAWNSAIREYCLKSPPKELQRFVKMLSDHRYDSSAAVAHHPE